MISVDEALRVVLDGTAPLPAVEVPLAEAHGLVLSADVAARDDVPFAAVSAMDGYAVRAADVRGADRAPVRLRLAAGLLAAGAAPARGLAAGEAAAIATGGVLPMGADAVVRKEDAAEVDGAVEIGAQVEEGENVRAAGDDMRAGEVVLERGRVLDGWALALAAAAGRAHLPVHRRPRAAILATGDELVAPEEEVGPARVRVSSSWGLRGRVIEAGATPVDLGVVRDDAAEIRERIEIGLAEADILLATGGVSVGARDLVRPVLESLGLALKFHGVAVKPGKPLLFGLVGTRPVFGLPGNPVSTLVSFEIFARPALLRLAGRSAVHRRSVRGVLDAEIRRTPGREEYLRAAAREEGGAWRAEVLEGQGSHQTKTLGRANALVVVPADVVALPAGAEVEILLLFGPDAEARRDGAG